MNKVSFMELDGIVDVPSVSLPFTVPRDFDWLEISIAFSKKGWYSILIWDANDRLIAQSLILNKPKTIIISDLSNETSFAAVSGKIIQGTWKIEILTSTYSDSHQFTVRCNGGVGSTMKEIGGVVWGINGAKNGFELQLYDAEKVFHSGTKWYKGDFHTHTTESDGKMTPINGMLQAKKLNLDFFAATDHNILPTKWVENTVMVIPGVEITSSKGHFNAIGLTKWIDWRPTSPDGGMETEAGMNRIIGEVKAAGAIVSINHPMLKPWEWQFRKTALADIDVIEIWNDPTYKDNPFATEQALKLWNTLWNDGHRIYGIGGSDSHLLPTESYEDGGPPSVIGDPASFVYGERLTARSILEGVKKGNVYVSRGPEFIINIIVNGQSFLPGNDLSGCFKSENEIHVLYDVIPIRYSENAYIHWIKNGDLTKKEQLQEGEIIQQQFTLKKGEAAWIRFEVRSNTGELLSFINPIFSGSKKPDIETWGQLLITTNLTP